MAKTARDVVTGNAPGSGGHQTDKMNLGTISVHRRLAKPSCCSSPTLPRTDRFCCTGPTD